MAFFGSSYLSLLLVVITIIFVYMKWLYKYWERRGVQAPRTTMLLGNAAPVFLLKKNFGETIRNAYQQFKPKGLKYCGFYFLWKPIFIPLDLDLIRNILTVDFQHFMDHGNYINEEIDPLSGHLFSLRGIKWKNMRAKLTPTFTSGKMKMMFPTLLSCSDGLVTVINSSLHDKEVGLDIKDIVSRYGTDVIGSCAFGIECNSLKNPNSDFRVYGRKIFELSASSFFRFLIGLIYPQLLQILNMPDIKPEVSKFFLNVVKQTVNYREKSNVTRKDFMQLLIQLKNSGSVNDLDENLNTTPNEGSLEPGKNLTISELAAQAYVFYAAGFETSSTTLTFCFYELATNQDIQQKLRLEIEEVMQKHNRKITYDALMEMTYMDKCIYEALRKYPPAPLIPRECTKTYKLPDSDLVIDKGTLVIIPVLPIQRDLEIYPNAECFDPERFSPKNKAQRHQFAWLPFGEGPRACIGLRFGMMQTKVALTVLLKNYKFTLNPKTKVPLVLDPKSIVLSAEGEIWLNAEKLAECA